MMCQIIVICTLNTTFNTIKVFLIFLFVFIFSIVKKLIQSAITMTNTLYSIFSNVVYLKRNLS